MLGFVQPLNSHGDRGVVPLDRQPIILADLPIQRVPADVQSPLTNLQSDKNRPTAPGQSP